MITIKEFSPILKNVTFPIKLLCYWAWMIGFFHGHIGLPRLKNTNKVVKWTTIINVKEN